jgi:hypothetical protein
MHVFIIMEAFILKTVKMLYQMRNLLYNGAASDQKDVMTSRLSSVDVAEISCTYFYR